MSWVQVVLDFLRQFWPFEIVYSYQKGVRFWCGHDTAELDPGLYMFVPFFGHIETVNVKPDILRLSNQNLTTRDGLGVSCDLTVAYEIFDARAAHVAVQQVVDNLADEARAALAIGVRTHTYDEILTDQHATEAHMLEAVNATAEEWGVIVSRVSLVDFIRTKNLSFSKL